MKDDKQTRTGEPKTEETSILKWRPPNDKEAEQKVIGSILLDPKCLTKVKQVLGNSEAFYQEDLKLIFECFLQLDEEKKLISVNTVRRHLKRRGETTIHVTASYLSDLLQQVASIEELDYFLPVLKEKHSKRSIYDLNRRTLQEASSDNGASAQAMKYELIESLGKIETDEHIQKPITVTQLLKKELPKTPYLIGNGLLPEQGYSMIAGEAKVGKTMLALYLALCLALKLPVFMREGDKTGMFPVLREAKTLFLFKENAEAWLKSVIQKQIAGIEELLDTTIKEKATDNIILLQPREVGLDTREQQRKFEEIVKAYPVDLVVIDPVSFFMTRDMNKREVVSRVAQFLNDLSQKYSCAFLLIHHFRKSLPQERENEEPFHRITGSAGWQDFYVSGITLERKKKSRSSNIMKLEFEMRSEESPAPIIVKRNPDTLLSMVINEKEVLEGATSVLKLIELIKENYPDGFRKDTITELGSQTWGVTKQRVYNLLRDAQIQGLIIKPPRKAGKWFLAEEQKLF